MEVTCNRVEVGLVSSLFSLAEGLFYSPGKITPIVSFLYIWTCCSTLWIFTIFVAEGCFEFLEFPVCFIHAVLFLELRRVAKRSHRLYFRHSLSSVTAYLVWSSVSGAVAQHHHDGLDAGVEQTKDHPLG